MSWTSWCFLGVFLYERLGQWHVSWGGALGEPLGEGCLILGGAPGAERRGAVLRAGKAPRTYFRCVYYSDAYSSIGAW